MASSPEGGRDRDPAPLPPGWSPALTHSYVHEAAAPADRTGSALAHGDLQLLPQIIALPWVGQRPGRPSPTLRITMMTKGSPPNTCTVLPGP